MQNSSAAALFSFPCQSRSGSSRTGEKWLRYEDSFIGKDYHTEEHVTGYYNAGDRMMYWGKAGAFLGGFWSLLFGSAFFAIPGIGPVLVAGPMVVWIIGALETAVLVGGFSALGAALASIGIPNNSVLTYETEIKNDKLLLVVQGSADEVEKAKRFLETNGIVTVHNQLTTVSN